MEAANGDPIAQYTIAYLTDQGNCNIPQDTAKAHSMYKDSIPALKKAAMAGNANACMALSCMYKDGKGVDMNKEMSMKYAKMAKDCAKMAKDCGTNCVKPS